MFVRSHVLGKIAFAFGIGVLLAGCAGDVTYSPPSAVNRRPYCINGKWHHPQAYYELCEEGMASHYGGNDDSCHGSPTALGITFNAHEMTAAHRTLPLPCVIFVENLENGRAAKVVVVDRGPYAKNRMLDVSARAAQILGFYKKGFARVRITTLVEESIRLSQKWGKYRPGRKRDRACEGMDLYVDYVLRKKKNQPQVCHPPSKVSDSSCQKSKKPKLCKRPLHQKGKNPKATGASKPLRRE